MRAYHRVDPLMDERKGHYTPAQFGAFLKVQLVAGRQTKRGCFRSLAALRMMLPGAYARHIDFLVAEGDLIVGPTGAVHVDGWEEWQEGDLTVRDRMAALRNRRRNATVTSDAAKPSPTATGTGTIGIGVGISVGEEVPSSSTRDGWADFSDDRWDAFKAAWRRRGFRLPPRGTPEDSESQRGILWEIADARPKDLARWVDEAPPGKAYQVVAYVLTRWHDVQDAVPKDAA